jgi:pseudouridine kinase
MIHPSSNHKIIGIGAVLVDEIFYCLDPAIPGTSNPACMKRSAGGVMHNIMHHLALLGSNPTFLTVTGDDEEGRWLKQKCSEAGIAVICKEFKDVTTGRYVAIINPGGSLHTAAVSNPCEPFLNIGLLQEQLELLSSATIVLADTNLDKEVLQWLIDFCRTKEIKLCIEPVSVVKAGKLSELNLEDVFMITPNEEELNAIIPGHADHRNIINELLKKGIQNIWLRCGMRGSAWYSNESEIKLPAPIVKVLDTTGAGDAALSGWMAAYTRGYDLPTCIKTGHALAGKVLETSGAIASEINFEELRNSIKSYYPDE